MRLTTYDETGAFERAARDFLGAREAENNLLFGLTATLRARPDAYGEAAPYLAIVRDGAGDIALAALMTPPHNLVVSAASDPAALDLLVADLQGLGGALPGVLGPSATARDFVERWERATGVGPVAERAERIYELTAVIAPRPVPGRLVRATEADRPLLLDWMDRFHIEVNENSNAASAQRSVDQRLSDSSGGLYLWIDGEPACMAGASGPTPTGIRVGPVYTPRDRRGRGYASACVGALSQSLLDDGRQRCFLFTDLANPTSNAIYQALGYRPVCDMVAVRLGRLTSAPSRG